MRPYKYPMPKPSEITSEAMFMNRRRFMAGASALALGSLAAPAHADELSDSLGIRPLNVAKMDSPYSIKEAPNSLENITEYNNFYEFGFDKGDPARNAGALTVDPWAIKVGGQVNNPGSIDINDLLNSPELEERIYRLRCVEAWSMVIPWVGIPLASLIKKYDVQGSAKYVQFQTLLRPEEMNGQSGRSGIDWPYGEGLRMDEAMHPLTILAVGLYGKTMPKQNGAPVRLVVPWKYGFKSIKSIVALNFTEEQPVTTWNTLQANEYGFYANVNPNVDHPRWSQASERVIGSGIFAKRRDTEMFNGYGEQVASLYDGMDLAKFY